ncbi:hypothetical protein SBRCBS47491_007219 [Sporothrix bragantina]|uniref:Glutaredoxin-like protein n=1 Tax=Sporothrix bragantina TaxID=671064 RepID=A0ABP0CBS8_9PEZI
MRITPRLFQQQLACRITLFTRANCGLCTRAKSALSAVWDVRPFDYHEVDIIDPAAQNWRNLYDLDVPVQGHGRRGGPQKGLQGRQAHAPL